MVREPYPVLESSSRAIGDGVIDELAAAYVQARTGAKPEHVQRHRSRGRLLPYERLELLLDPDSWFLELCPLAGHGIKGEYTGTTVRGGIGLISGVPCVVILSESTLRGGAVSEYAMKKMIRLGEVAEENGLATVSLIESAGADLSKQSRIFLPGGQTFRDLSRRSAGGLPSVCVVFGSSTAGGAYVPGMSDYTVFVKEQAHVYLAGPPLVKMATGEVADHETLGGAVMHAEVSGLCDQLAESEPHGLQLARQIVSQLAAGEADRLPCTRPFAAPRSDAPLEPPRYASDGLLAIAGEDPKVLVDPRDIIARIVDGSRFLEFKPRYGTTLVTGWAGLFGQPVGILANHGVLFGDAAQKGAHFIQLCNQSRTPLLFLQNITGFMVGSDVERGGIIKDGAKLINAVSNSQVPAITLMTGASYGAGNYAMAGRAYAPRFLFTWPNHKIAVMGGRQLAGVLELVQREAAEKKGISPDEEKLAIGKKLIEAQVEEESSALYASARLWDDGVIDPRDSRWVLGLALAVSVRHMPQRGPRWGVFRH